MVGEKVELDCGSNRCDPPHLIKGTLQAIAYLSKLTFSAKGYHLLSTQQGYGMEQINQLNNSLMQIIPSAHNSSQIVESTQK